MEKIFTFGEVMLRIQPKNLESKIIQSNQFLIEPAGSEANVAIALSKLGHSTSMLSCAPDTDLGQLVNRYLAKHGVESKYISKNDKRIGVYYTELGVGIRASNVIYDRADSGLANVKHSDFDWKNIKKEAIWFHTSGITAAISKNAYDVLLKVFQEFDDIPISIDLNYRKKLWDWVQKDKNKIHQKMKALCKHATLVSGNETDFQDCLGINGSCEEIAEKSFKEFPNLKYLAISFRDSLSASINVFSGFLFAKEASQIQLYKGPDLMLKNIVDRIGTGDSFTGGVLHGILSNNKNFQEIVDFAVTLAALNHTIPGDASEFNENDILHAMNTKGSGRIQR